MVRNTTSSAIMLRSPWLESTYRWIMALTRSADMQGSWENGRSEYGRDEGTAERAGGIAREGGAGRLLPTSTFSLPAAVCSFDGRVLILLPVSSPRAATPGCFPGSRSTMKPPASGDFTSRRRILVADEDRKIVEYIITTLREDGHAVFHAYDGLSATELALALGKEVHLVISNTKV